MPKRRYEQREPTHDWQQIRPLLKDTAQITYEVIRPCILGWETPKERAAETGMPMSSIYYKANLFDQAGMASLLPPAPPPEIPKQDKRSLPPHIRQEIVDLHAQYPAFRPHEIATICFVKFNRKPAPATIKLILASGPKPSTTELCWLLGPSVHKIRSLPASKKERLEFRSRCSKLWMISANSRDACSLPCPQRLNVCANSHATLW